MSTDLARAEYVRNNRNKFSHYQARQRDKLKLEMVEAYGGKCVHCQIENPVVLTGKEISSTSPEDLMLAEAINTTAG